MLLLVVFLSLWSLPGLNLKIQAPNGSGDAANQASSNADMAKPATTLPVQNPGSAETMPAPQALEPVAPDQELAGSLVADKAQLAVGEATTNAVTSTAVPPLVLAPPGAAAAGLDARWLAEQSVLSWQGLADVWQDSKRVNALRAACDGQPGTGYACLHIQGNWGKIQRLGLPVILVLQDDLEYQLMLTGMDEDRLLVGVGAERRLFDRKALDSKWLGEYIVAWPQAPDWPMQVQRGETGAAVKIVMQMAAQADPPWTGADQFDAGFESWLFDFQRRQGLIPDGIVGPQTLLYLMAPTITEPRLAVNLDEGYS
jgi:murein L,D-transpeptidase YcbB/YkuD